MTIIPVQHVARAIRAEYLELPGLSLTRAQVQRLYSIDGTISEAILAALVDLNFLVRTEAGRYVRAERNEAGAGRRTDVVFQAA